MTTSQERRSLLLEDLAAPVRNALVGGPFGSDLVSADYTVEGVPVIRGENLTYGRWVAGDFVFVSDDKARRLSANTAGPLDLVFTQRGANHFRQVALVDQTTTQRFVISQSQMKLTVDTRKADPLYVYYLFRDPLQQEYLQRHAIQTGVPHTNLSILRRVPLSIPCLSKQRDVVEVLGALDDKIELNQRMNETLEAMARAFFKSWFVDFDPVLAKAEGRAPAGMDAATAALFPDGIERSEQGEMPHGWRSGRLGDIAALNSWTLGQGDAIESVRYVEISDVVRGRILGTTRYPRGQEPSRARRRLRHGDTVISTVRPERASYFLCLNPTLDLVGSTGFAVLTPSKLPWAFLHAGATQPDVFAELGRLADGGAYPAIRGEVVADQPIVIPDLAVAAAFQDLAAPLFERVAANETESSTLAQVRDTLLPKLLSGELRVRDAEKAVGQVA